MSIYSGFPASRLITHLRNTALVSLVSAYEKFRGASRNWRKLCKLAYFLGITHDIGKLFARPVKGRKWSLHHRLNLVTCSLDLVRDYIEWCQHRRLLPEKLDEISDELEELTSFAHNFASSHHPCFFEEFLDSHVYSGLYLKAIPYASESEIADVLYIVRSADRFCSGYERAIVEVYEGTVKSNRCRARLRGAPPHDGDRRPSSFLAILEPSLLTPVSAGLMARARWEMFFDLRRKLEEAIAQTTERFLEEVELQEIDVDPVLYADVYTVFGTLPHLFCLELKERVKSTLHDLLAEFLKLDDLFTDVKPSFFKSNPDVFEKLAGETLVHFKVFRGDDGGDSQTPAWLGELQLRVTRVLGARRAGVDRCEFCGSPIHRVDKRTLRFRPRKNAFKESFNVQYHIYKHGHRWKDCCFACAISSVYARLSRGVGDYLIVASYPSIDAAAIEELASTVKERVFNERVKRAVEELASHYGAKLDDGRDFRFYPGFTRVVEEFLSQEKVTAVVVSIDLMREFVEAGREALKVAAAALGASFQPSASFIMYSPPASLKDGGALRDVFEKFSKLIPSLAGGGAPPLPVELLFFGTGSLEFFIPEFKLGSAKVMGVTVDYTDREERGVLVELMKLLSRYPKVADTKSGVHSLYLHSFAREDPLMVFVSNYFKLVKLDPQRLNRKSSEEVKIAVRLYELASHGGEPSLAYLARRVLSSIFTALMRSRGLGE